MRESASGSSGAPVRVGVVGCGMISAVYLANLTSDPRVSVVACADLDPERARLRAADHAVALALPPDDLLAREDVDLVVNLTVPSAHAEITRRALEAGRAVYSEKPLALTGTEADDLVALARSRGLPLGCAPDTILGPGLRAGRRLVDEGAIGRPFAATAHMLSSGVASWHPEPEPWYRPGGGPLFDMGPYYLTALCDLLGPVALVQAEAASPIAQRAIGTGPRAGSVLPVETPTHVAGLLRFASGAIGSLVMSFDVLGAHQPLLEVYGTEGALALPDPNTFVGPVRWTRGEDGWRTVTSPGTGSVNLRGIGVLELVDAWREGREPRASGTMAAHVVRVMESLLAAAEHGAPVAVATA